MTYFTKSQITLKKPQKSYLKKCKMKDHPHAPLYWNQGDSGKVLGKLTIPNVTRTCINTYTRVYIRQIEFIYRAYSTLLK